jgi:FkbM family methyltransferase
MTITIRPHGTTIRMHRSPGKITRSMAHGVPYESYLLEYIYQRRFSGLALDVGANIGNHTLWFALVCGLHTVAFEPVYTAELRRNVELNGADELVTIEEYGLSDGPGTAVHHGQGRLTERGVEYLPNPNVPDMASGLHGSIGLAVNLRTLDSFKLTGVGLIKVDVEGMEPLVLLGGEQTIRRDRPVIYTEVWSDADHRQIAEVLEPWEYTMTKRFDRRQLSTPVEEWSAQ